MTPQQTKYYVDAMDIIKARERLVDMDSSQYPHMIPKARKQSHRELYKRAYPDNFKEKVVNLSDIRLI